MKFIDKAKIYVRSGQGGNGKVSFRREKSVPLGGPDGGDGGNGGAIIFYVDEHKDTLIDFANKIHFKAEAGECGKASNAYGKSGKDLVINIPLGTQIYDENNKILLFEALKLNERFVLFPGGKGGAGNARFVSSTNRTPRNATPGEPFEEAWLNLVLKIFCDYGYVGLPNAGKSSLLKILTGSATKIGDYPFTTLSPEVGTLWNFDKKIVMADLPGIIKGASDNKGLGLKFLGYIERCKGIFHIIDVSVLNSLENLEMMLYEINQFSEGLLKKKQIVILNKIDLIKNEELLLQIKEIKEKYDFEIFAISCLEKKGIDEFLKFLFSQF